jgi:hypothetical protein
MSEFPVTASGSVLQRRRWLHGHLQIAFREAPRLLITAVERRSFVLATLAGDLLVPPLVLLAFAVNGIFALTLGFGLIASVWIPGMLAGMAVALFATFLIAAWFYCGRDIIGRAELAEVPRHTWRVLRAAVDLFVGTRSSWERAERASDFLSRSTRTIDSSTEAEKCSADRPSVRQPRQTASDKSLGNTLKTSRQEVDRCFSVGDGGCGTHEDVNPKL